MDQTILIAIIGAAAIVFAALIAVMPKLLKRRSLRGEVSQKDNSREVPLREHFQGNLTVLHETILIVVGTSIGAERYDRLLAQLLKRIFHNANIEAEIVTDVFCQNHTNNLKSNPLICIGSRGANQIVKQYENEFELRDRETPAKVCTDGQRPLAFIYGGGVRETYEATLDFCKSKIIVFADKWSSRYTRDSKSIEIPSNIEDLLKEIVVISVRF